MNVKISLVDAKKRRGREKGGLQRENINPDTW